MAVYCTPCLRDYVTHLRLSVNGFEVFNTSAPHEERFRYKHDLKWVDETAKELAGRDWIALTRSSASVDVSRTTLARER